MVCFLKIIFCIWGALGARANCVSLPYLLFSMGRPIWKKISHKPQTQSIKNSSPIMLSL